MFSTKVSTSVSDTEKCAAQMSNETAEYSGNYCNIDGNYVNIQTFNPTSFLTNEVCNKVKNVNIIILIIYANIFSLVYYDPWPEK